jgi:hypothetical protein
MSLTRLFMSLLYVSRGHSVVWPHFYSFLFFVCFSQVDVVFFRCVCVFFWKRLFYIASVVFFFFIYSFKEVSYSMRVILRVWGREGCTDQSHSDRRTHFFWHPSQFSNIESLLVLVKAPPIILLVQA